MLSKFKTNKNNLQSKTGKPFWNFSNTMMCMAIFLVLPTCTFTALSALLPVLNPSLFLLMFSSNKSPYATSIPWIDNANECQYTNRNWHDNKCWDEEHSPTF